MKKSLIINGHQFEFQPGQTIHEVAETNDIRYFESRLDFNN
jgi:hypothetical protein